MASVVLAHVSKTFDDVVAVDDLTPRGRRRGVPRAARAVGLREVDRAADDRRARGADRGHDRDRRPRRQRRRGQGPRRRDGVPELRAVPAHDGAPEHRVPAAVAQGPGGRARRSSSPRRPSSLGLDDLPRPQARAALGRSAAAGRARAGDRAPAAGVPDGRAAVEPRRQAARADARRAHRAAATPRGDDRVRHPRPGRGDDDGRPHRDHERGRAPAGRAAAGRVRAPGEPVRGPLHRQPADEHGRRSRDARRRCTRSSSFPVVASPLPGRARRARSSSAGSTTSCSACGPSICDSIGDGRCRGHRVGDRVARPRAPRRLPPRGRHARDRPQVDAREPVPAMGETVRLAADVNDARTCSTPGTGERVDA